MNTRCLEEAHYRKNEDLKAYHSADDKRLKVCLNFITYMYINFESLQWLIDDFLEYLKEWETEVDGRKDLKKSERNKMILSRETLDGLKMTGNDLT